MQLVGEAGSDGLSIEQRKVGWVVPAYLRWHRAPAHAATLPAPPPNSVAPACPCSPTAALVHCRGDGCQPQRHVPGAWEDGRGTGRGVWRSMWRGMGLPLHPTPDSPTHQDEPTSGLDARAAAIVMRAVKNVALSGRTVMVVVRGGGEERIPTGGSHPSSSPLVASHAPYHSTPHPPCVS